MAKYHIHPETGEPGSCRARKSCPFGGEELHFPTAQAARENFERQQELLEAAFRIKPKSSPFTDAAFASSLTYSGKPPRWFNKIPTTLQENLFGCKPELLDVIDGPQGKLAVVWENNSVEPNDIWLDADRGFNTTRLTFRDFRTGEVKAYLKTSSQNEESQKRSFGTDEWRGFRYIAERESFYEMDRTYPKSRDYKPSDKTIHRMKIDPPKLETEEELRHFNLKAREALNLYGRKLLSSMNEEELREELTFLQEEANEKLKIELENYKTPYIDFSRVDDSLRGKGLGHALYIYTARKLAERGLGLRASGLQSPEAEKSWSLMAADKRFPITVKNWLYKHRGQSSIQACYLMQFKEES